jgi:hypothetical protein
MERSVRGPDGRDWVVHGYRFRRPPWRQLGSGFGLLDPDEGFGLVYVPLLLVYVVLAPLTLVVFPLVVFLAEAAVRAAWSLVASPRWVEAVHEGPAFSRMTWVTDAGHEQAVVEQVSRQLELGYDRVQPHRARFLGFR